MKLKCISNLSFAHAKLWDPDDDDDKVIHCVPLVILVSVKINEIQHKHTPYSYLYRVWTMWKLNECYFQVVVGNNTQILAIVITAKWLLIISYKYPPPSSRSGSSSSKLLIPGRSLPDQDDCDLYGRSRHLQRFWNLFQASFAVRT